MSVMLDALIALLRQVLGPVWDAFLDWLSDALNAEWAGTVGGSMGYA